MILFQKKRRMTDRMSPIGWVILGGIMALGLAPTVKRVVKETEIGNRDMLRKVKRNFQRLINKTDIKEQLEEKNKVRIRRRKMLVGANKIN